MSDTLMAKTLSILWSLHPSSLARLLRSFSSQVISASETSQPLALAASAMAYVTSCLAYGLTAARYLRVQMFMSIAVTVVLIAASFWLIPSRGLLGAAIALLITRSVHAGGSLAVTGYALRELHRQTGGSRA